MTTAPAAPTEPRTRGALIPVVAEALRIEEHCEFLNQASSLAGAWNRRLHFWFGLAAAILAGGAGAIVLTGSHDRVAATAALVAAVAAALVTFLNPEEHAGKRLAQAAAYRQLGTKRGCSARSTSRTWRPGTPTGASPSWSLAATSSTPPTIPRRLLLPQGAPQHEADGAVQAQSHPAPAPMPTVRAEDLRDAGGEHGASPARATPNGHASKV